MPTKPTDTRTSAFPELDDFEGILKPKKVNPLSKVEPEPEHHQKTHHGDPELRRASGAETRASTAGISLPGHMRDLLNRLPNELGAGEIDDDEAARRAGLNPNNNDDDAVRPRTPNTDVVTRQTLPDALKNSVQVAGTRNPKWHTINNLPGYMARAIRAMGRGMFDMITRTPLEDIQTIANVNGQGPNSEEELRAVAGWLRDNAEEVRTLDFDYSQLMPGYDPEVKEYRTDGIRFHVVRDEMGHYIYAYPEQDAKEPGEGPRGLGQDRRRLSGPHNESKENKVYNPADEIKRNIQLLESLEEDIDGSKEINQLMEELVALEAYRGKASKARYMDPAAQQKRMSRHSTLAPLLKDVPGGPRLISWLHKELQLGSEADWSSERAQQFYEPRRPMVNRKVDGVSTREPSTKNVSTTRGSGIWLDLANDIGVDNDIKNPRIMWEIIKSEPDNFIVFVGTDGCGAVRPKPGYIESVRKNDPGRNFAKDVNLPYVYAFFTADQKWENTNPTEGGFFDPNTKKFLTRGGMVDASEKDPNMLDVIKSFIGKIRSAHSTYAAEPGESGTSVEREKVEKRAAAKAGPADNRNRAQLERAVFEKIRPVILKLCKNAVGMINRKAQRAINGGNWDEAQRIARAGNDLNSIVAALEDPQQQGIPYALSSKFTNALSFAAREQGVNQNDDADYKEFLSSALSVGPETKLILDALRSVLVGATIQE